MKLAVKSRKHIFTIKNSLLFALYSLLFTLCSLLFTLYSLLFSKNSMTDTVIKVENLSKQYRIGAKEGYKTFRESLVDAAKAPFRGIQQLINPQSAIRNPQSETIWALKDVSFEVKRGEVVGIIGRNGAGKSTLLKILSKITEPTEGRIELRGRVGSLLEVGTGFHPELTGHENIYLYGAVLGMDRWEVTRKFDEIVAFAELEKFIDTPVKRYSSGMYMRLAFAVAAHLESEILLVDEVLAVGDASFQKKCLGKMGTVSKEGRTILFVSHNLGAIGSLCKTAFLLEGGKVDKKGPTSDVITHYVNKNGNSEDFNQPITDDDNLGYQLILREKEIKSICGIPLSIQFTVLSPEPVKKTTTGLVIYDVFDNPVVGASSKFQGVWGEGVSNIWCLTCMLGKIPLNSGRYYVSVWFGDRYRDYAKFSKAFTIYILPADPFGWGNKVPESWGHFFWKPQWQISPFQSDGHLHKNDIR